MALLIRVTVTDELAAEIETAPSVLWTIRNWRLDVITDDGKHLEFSGTPQPPLEE